MDGSFKGKLISTGDLVIGATGVVRGNIEHLREVHCMVIHDCVKTNANFYKSVCAIFTVYIDLLWTCVTITDVNWIYSARLTRSYRTVLSSETFKRRK